MTTIASNLQAVRDAIAAAAIKAGRHAEEVTLLAVSKNFPHHALREAYRAGQTCFAESYVQEALDKIAALHDLPSSGITSARSRATRRAPSQAISLGRTAWTD